MKKPVLVVGAGPVGLAAAINLTLRDYPVRIVESRSEPSTYSKAIGINARTLALLEPSGVTERLLDVGLKIPRINFQSADRVLFTVEFSKVAHPYNFMLGLPQSETEHILEQRLREFGVRVERNAKLKRFDQRPDSVIGYLVTTSLFERSPKALKYKVSSMVSGRAQRDKRRIRTQKSRQNWAFCAGKPLKFNA